MNPITSKKLDQESGFEVCTLRSAEMEVLVVPALGARILSLRDLRSGREWLDRPLGNALFRNQFGDDFTSSTFAGADECIPTIAPTQWKGRNLPDHGEAWALPWALDAEAWERNVITTRIRLPLTPLVVTRTVQVSGEEVTLDYRVENCGSAPEEFLWALHPLIAIRPGDRLELPPEVRALSVEAAAGLPGSVSFESWAWPGPGGGVQLDRLDLGGEAYAKLFAGPLREGAAAIVNPETGDRLAFRWNARENPWLGIWLTRGKFRGFHHVAIEPSNGGSDSLAIAAAGLDSPAPLAPGEVRTWRICLRLSVFPH